MKRVLYKRRANARRFYVQGPRCPLEGCALYADFAGAKISERTWTMSHSCNKNGMYVCRGRRSISHTRIDNGKCRSGDAWIIG